MIILKNMAALSLKPISTREPLCGQKLLGFFGNMVLACYPTDKMRQTMLIYSFSFILATTLHRVFVNVPCLLPGTVVLI